MLKEKLKHVKDKGKINDKINGLEKQKELLKQNIEEQMDDLDE